MQQFWHLLSKHGLYFEESKGIHLDFCLFALTGQYSEDQANSVRTVKKLYCSFNNSKLFLSYSTIDI